MVARAAAGDAARRPWLGAAFAAVLVLGLQTDVIGVPWIAVVVWAAVGDAVYREQTRPAAGETGRVVVDREPRRLERTAHLVVREQVELVVLDEMLDTVRRRDDVVHLGRGDALVA